MAEIVFKTIWQSDELSQVQKGGQEQTRSRGDMPEASLEHQRKEKKWLFTKKKKTECSKAIDDVQLSCPELRRSAASTNVSTLNLSCEKDSTDSSGSWDIRKMKAPLATTEDVRALWAVRHLSSSPCMNFLESIERSKNVANVLKECTRKLQKKSKEMEQRMADIENNIARQKSLTIEEKLINLCQKIKKDHLQWRERLAMDDDPGAAGTAGTAGGELGSPLLPAGPQVQAMEQIARSMGDLRQALAAQLSGVKEAGSRAGTGTAAGSEGQEPNTAGSERQVSKATGNTGQEPNTAGSERQVSKATGNTGQEPNTTGSEGQVPHTKVQTAEGVRGTVGCGVSRSQSWLRKDELRTLSQFQGRFEALQVQWERTHSEHQHTARMLRDLKSEIDTIAHTSKMMFSAFDQIQKNVSNLNHLKPLIENIQNLLETKRSQRNIEPGYASPLDQRIVQGEALQHLVDQAVLPLVAKIRMCHLTFTCNQCCRKCKLSMP